MDAVMLTMRQARRFLLRRHGLLGGYRFKGKKGALEFVRGAGCIQFDPVDVCGKNAELTLQSRVGGFTKAMLDELLYKDRKLVDYPDKNQAIMPVDDWPYFERYRSAARECGAQFDGLREAARQTVEYIRENGPVSSASLPIEGRIRWHSAIHWSGNWHGDHPAGRAALEQLYSEGRLVIHHKQGSRKFYDLAERHIPEAILSRKDPLEDEIDNLTWRVHRRIGAVGLMWDRPSDAWLHIWGLDAEKRSEAFRRLSGRGDILPAKVDGVRGELWYRKEELPVMREILSEKRFISRCEAIAPLDPFLWDRKLIKALFGFQYSWEIYTPAEMRKYGYYVLPLIYGDVFAGRIEVIPENGVMHLRHFWPEDGFRRTQAFDKALEDCVRRIAVFNGCNDYMMEPDAY